MISETGFVLYLAVAVVTALVVQVFLAIKMSACTIDVRFMASLISLVSGLVWFLAIPLYCLMGLSLLVPPRKIEIQKRDYGI
jgi:hypothetical protein